MDKKAAARPVACMVIAFSLAMLGFYFLYRTDNKYTWDSPQPLSGLLILSSEDLERHPLQFPFQQWQFYPDQLLKPEDLKNDAYSRYVFIGQYSGFNADNAGLPRHGRGSYRLSVSVPELELEYALELPEVFSACRLYINGRLALELGSPDTRGYRPEIQSRVVTFLARGSIEILLAVSNYSHYTGGFTYPPAFGQPAAVQSARDARLMIRLAACLLALFVSLFAMWSGLRLGRPQGVLFALLCLCFIGSTGYPLLHAFFATDVQPWYTVELVCHNALFPLAVALHNGLCGIRGRARWAVMLPLAAFCLVALAYGLCSPLISHGLAGSFSTLSAIIKLLTAAWLLAVSIWAVRRRAVKAVPMLAATTIFAASLFADRLWPLYEPVYGGWFGEIGCATLTVALAVMLWADFAEAYRFRAAFSEERRYLARQLELQRSHYQRLVGQIEEARFLRHDLRHHMRTLYGFAQDGALAEVRNYLAQIGPKLVDGEPMSYTGHIAADAVLQHFAAWAKKLDAQHTFLLDIPPDIAISGDELCIVLGNLLENAAEALERQREGEKYLYLNGRLADGKLALVVENSFDGHVSAKGERFYSHKRDGFGIGIQSVRAIVRRHGGLCDFEARGNAFHASVLIPVPSASTDGSPYAAAVKGQ